MRAKEFTINIPINITMNADGSVGVSTGEENDTPDTSSAPVMVPPLQQHIELSKAKSGKHSAVIDTLTQDEYAADAEDDTIDSNRSW